MIADNLKKDIESSVWDVARAYGVRSIEVSDTETSEGEAAIRVMIFHDRLYSDEDMRPLALLPIRLSDIMHRHDDSRPVVVWHSDPSPAARPRDHSDRKAA